jgi:hypothetical protein
MSVEERNLNVEQTTSETPPVIDRGKPARKLSWESLTLIPLILILLLGAYFRFTGLNWDNNHHLHPDERFLTIVATQLEPVSNPLDYLRTSQSTLNPYNVGQGFYVYGNFPMTVTRYAAEWASAVCNALTAADGTQPIFCAYTFTAYDGIHLLGRFLSGLVDLVSVLFIFLIGRRLYDWRVGSLAALLLAAAVMPIQQSHFFTMDTWAAALTTMTLYMAVRAAGLGDENPRWYTRWWVLFGLGLGLAVASRINIAPLAAMAAVAAVIWLVQRGHDWRAVTKTTRGSIDLQRAIIGVLLAAIVSIAAFRLAQPYAFADTQIARQEVIAQTGQEPGPISVALRAIVGFNPQWQSNMSEIQQQQTPEASFPPALQWTDRTPILFPLTNMVLYGMGLTAGIAAWLGLLWALWRMARLRPGWTAHAIPVVWSGFYFLFMGTRWVKSIRYFLPIYPTLLLLAAWALFALWQRANENEEAATRLYRRIGVAALMAVVLVPSLLWANAFIQIYQQPMTRVAASRWIFENIPSGATLFYEKEGETQELQLPLKQFQFQPDGPPLLLHFTMPEDGAITAVRFNYLSDPDGNQTDSEMLHVTLEPGDDTTPIDVPMDLGNQPQAVRVDLPHTPATADSIHQLVVQPGAGSNVHAGTSILMNEHWDDLLPVGVDGRNAYGSYYTEVGNGQRPVTNPDSPEKRQEMVNWLEEADYIILSSQRALWSLPRLPLTYPLMVR